MSKNTKPAAKKPAAPKAAKPAAPKASAQPRKNGMVHPREGGKTAAIWAISDSLTKSLKRTPTRAEVMAAAPRGAKPNMVATQYGYWRRFHGITGRVSLPKPAKVKPAKPAKKPAKPSKPAAPKPAAPAKPTPPAAPAPTAAAS